MDRPFQHGTDVHVNVPLLPQQRYAIIRREFRYPLIERWITSSVTRSAKRLLSGRLNSAATATRTIRNPSISITCPGMAPAKSLLRFAIRERCTIGYSHSEVQNYRNITDLVLEDARS